MAEKVFLNGPMAGIGAEEADVDGATVGDLPLGESQLRVGERALELSYSDISRAVR